MALNKMVYWRQMEIDEFKIYFEVTVNKTCEYIGCGLEKDHVK